LRWHIEGRLAQFQASEGEEPYEGSDDGDGAGDISPDPIVEEGDAVKTPSGGD